MRGVRDTLGALQDSLRLLERPEAGRNQLPPEIRAGLLALSRACLRAFVVVREFSGNDPGKNRFLQLVKRGANVETLERQLSGADAAVSASASDLSLLLHVHSLKAMRKAIDDNREQHIALGGRIQQLAVSQRA